MRFFYLLVCISLMVGCDKKKADEGQKASVKKTTATQLPPLPTAASQEAQPEKKVTKPEDPKKKIYGEPRDLNREYDRETLEKAYVEIDCARLKNDPAKLEAIFHKYGFNHPKLWTAAWAKASKDKEWVSKLVLAAHKACPRPTADDAESETKSP